MKLNQKIVQKTINDAGLVVNTIPPIKQLKRLVLASMLWENQFYVDGQTSAALIQELVKKVNPTQVAEVAVQARQEQQLRHVPLFLARELARIGKLQADTLVDIIQRADEISEFLSIYWKEGKTPIANQIKKGLAACFNKFNEYQLAKWDHNSAAISLRDAMFMVHARPKDDKQAELFRKLANKELATPDTWETNLSAGADKRETFTRLMAEKKLGALAFLRNLRNMLQAGISETEIRAYAEDVNLERVLPFRFITAARYAPQLEDMLEDMMFRSCSELPKIKGKTVLMVDVSGSMFGAKVSAKSELDRFDAAAALAMLAREVCEEVEIYTFSNTLKRVAPRRGFALREALFNSQSHGGTYTGAAINDLHQQKIVYDRIILFTDEQTYDTPPVPKGKGYILNVASYQNGINNAAWTTITGFSEKCLDYIREVEEMETNPAEIQ